MNRYLPVIGATLFCVAAARAQVEKAPRTPPETRADNPLSGEIKQSYQTVKNNIIKSAQEMPEENYSFKPTPDIRSFAQVLGHIAESQMRTCSAAIGAPKSIDEASK